MSQILDKLKEETFFISTTHLRPDDIKLLHRIVQAYGYATSQTANDLARNTSGLVLRSDGNYYATDYCIHESRIKYIAPESILAEWPKEVYADSILPVSHPDYDRIMVHSLD